MSEKQQKIALFRVLGTQCDRKLQKLIKMNDFFINHLVKYGGPLGLEARIAGSHPAGPGSIHGVGELFLFYFFSRIINKKKKNCQFDLIKFTLSRHFFNVSTKLYEVLHIPTTY